MKGCLTAVFSSGKHDYAAKDSFDEDEEQRDQFAEDLLPRLSDSQRRQSESMSRQLSTLQAPMDVSWSDQQQFIVNYPPPPIYYHTPPETTPQQQRPSTPPSPTSPAPSSGVSAPNIRRLTTMSAAYSPQSAGDLTPGYSSGLEPRASTRFDWSISRKVLESAIAIEQDNETSNGGGYGECESIAVQEQRIALRLHKLRLDHYIAVGDGNCQFRSVAFALFGTQELHGRVRAKAVQYMRQHRADFEAFLGEDFHRYATEMSRNCVWGDELTLRAICEAYGIVINVITSDAENWFLRYIPANKTAQHEVFLTYISPVHYNSVKRKKKVDLLRSLSGNSANKSRQIVAALNEYEQRNELPSNPQELMAVTE